MRILLTGFEPFGGDDANPSWDAVSALADDGIGDDEVTALRLPVVYGVAADRLEASIAELSPDLVVATGLAAGREVVSLERTAINVRDARIPDAAGASPVDEPVDPTGPAARFTRLPIKAALAAARGAGLPVAVSESAGTYVCNDVFYRLLATAGERGIPAGFVHVPATTTVPLPEIVASLASIVATCVRIGADADARLAAGSVA